MKQFQVIARDFLLPPDEINNIYVGINDDLQITVNIYNGLTVNDRLSPRGLFVKITFKGGGLFGRGVYSGVGAY